MNKNFSDEKFDAVIKELFARSSMDDVEVNDIADSPATWWAVQRRIAEQSDAAKSAWPPVMMFWRLLKFGVPAFAAVALIVGLIVFRTQPGSTEKAIRQIVPVEVSETMLPASHNSDASTISAEQPVPARSNAVVRINEKRVSTIPVMKPTVKARTVTKATEIKTEFIALSYARDAESGQVVRVKVPSSMMVTLGLVSTVEKPSNLVDAEIIVGDDGLTRAIRFIR